jgi:hypothetical protein
MSKSAAFEASVLALVLNATGIANIADNTATSPLTDLYVAMHTASPGVAGTQSTSEITYTGYGRVAVARSAGSPAWTITGSNPASASPNANITFPVSAGGTGGTITYFSVGSEASGAGEIYYFGTVTPNIVVTSGVQPVLTTASTITET